MLIIIVILNEIITLILIHLCYYNYRVFLPTLEEYFSEAIEQADPDAMVEDEYKYESCFKQVFFCFLWKTSEQSTP